MVAPRAPCRATSARDHLPRAAAALVAIKDALVTLKMPAIRGFSPLSIGLARAAFAGAERTELPRPTARSLQFAPFIDWLLVPRPKWAIAHFERRIGMKGRFFMLRWAVIFFVIALVSAVFGFMGIADTSAWIAKVLFVVFLVMAVVSLLMGRRAVV